MSLVNEMKKGVKLVGLYRLLVPDLSAYCDKIVAGKRVPHAKPAGDPYAPFDASWIYEKGGLFSANTITFSKDPGANAIRMLPFKPNANADTMMGANEVLSGEFNGCIMGVYTGADGVVHVNHVDTSGSSPGNPCDTKRAWMVARSSPDVNKQNEFSTNGVISQFGSKDPAVFALCIASPQVGYPIHAILVKRDVASGVYTVLKRVKQTGRSMEDDTKDVKFI